MKPPTRRGRCTLISLLILCALPALGQGTKEFTLDDAAAGGRFSSRGIRGMQWIEGGKAWAYLETDSVRKQTDIRRCDVKSGKKTLLVDAADLVLHPGERPFAIQNYRFSPDESTILFTGTLAARALKTGGNFFLFDRKAKTFRQLTNSSDDQENVKFSPDGRKIGFVRANNLVVLDLASGAETRLTSDGSEHVLNGHFDWVYEEEFGIIDGWQWSPDGRSIAFWQLDETREPEFPIVNFMPLDQEVVRQRYPKPGDKNAEVRIGVVPAAGGAAVWVDAGEPFDSTQDYYIPRMAWTPKGKLVVHRLNRQQNRLELLLCDPASGAAKPFLTEEEATWVDVKPDYLFLKRDEAVVWPSERDGYRHLYRCALDGSKPLQLTAGKWEVDHIVGLDEDEKTVYFTASVTSPLERDLYAVGLDGKGFRRVTKGSGTHTINAAPGMAAMLDTWSNTDTPASVKLIRPDGTVVRTIDEGRNPLLDGYRLTKKELFTFTTSDGVQLNGWMMKPVPFDPSKKYPVLMTVYGGPGSQTVANSWEGGNIWYQYLAQHGYVVASVDNRGTGARGKEFRSVTYKRLGLWETHDQIEGAKYLASLPFVDGGRIGIHGGSYGGYMTLMCMLKGAAVFKAGLAVSSVTDWKFYDSIYTERYMLTPAGNPDGYRESSTLTYADSLRGNLLIIHGTDDDNVHMSNSITLMNELIRKNKQFETLVYPGSKHGIRARLHYITALTDYIMKNL